MMVGARKHAASSATVHIHVRELAQMLNSMDPSPFWDRDLDRDAAAFIEEEFRERRFDRDWHLTVHVKEGDIASSDLQTAVERYYKRLVSSARLELHDHIRMAQLALAGGLAVFALCMTVRELLLAAMNGLPRVLDEGLIILAWLALWRPAETLAYEWVPLLRKRRLYERLSGIRVAVRRAESARTRKQETHAL